MCDWWMNLQLKKKDGRLGSVPEKLDDALETGNLPNFDVLYLIS